MSYEHHIGFMPAGNDLHSEEMTLGAAKAMASTQGACLGFTFAGPAGDPPDEAMVTVHFKSAECAEC